MGGMGRIGGDARGNPGAAQQQPAARVAAMTAMVALRLWLAVPLVVASIAALGALRSGSANQQLNPAFTDAGPQQHPLLRLDVAVHR